MTPQEFKAWFEGFTEAFTGVPTKAQWMRVKERVGEIDGKPVTERVFVDRYWPAYPQRYWEPAWTYLSGNATNTIPCTAQSNIATLAQYQGATTSFNSAQAMTDLGRADAKALAS